MTHDETLAEIRHALATPSMHVSPQQYRAWVVFLIEERHDMLLDAKAAAARRDDR